MKKRESVIESGWLRRPCEAAGPTRGEPEFEPRMESLGKPAELG
jgi:hypothetical protein